MAVRRDGTVIISAMTNSGLPPLVIVQNGQLSQILLPPSTSIQPNGMPFYDFSPMGPPMVSSDGSAYVEVK
jgi:hypothetical protein